jgi:hypothetical protein
MISRLSEACVLAPIFVQASRVHLSRLTGHMILPIGHGSRNFSQLILPWLDLAAYPGLH